MTTPPSLPPAAPHQMNATPPCPNATPEWAVKAAEEFFAPAVFERCMSVQTLVAIIQKHAPTAPLPTVAPHLAGLVERLEHEIVLTRKCQKHPTVRTSTEVLLTEAIAALTDGAREEIRRISHLNRLASWAQQDPTGPWEKLEIQAWVLNEIRGALGQAVDETKWQPSYATLRADLARLTAENERLKVSLADAYGPGTENSLRAQLQAATAERDALDTEARALAGCLEDLLHHGFQYENGKRHQADPDKAKQALGQHRARGAAGGKQ